MEENGYRFREIMVGDLKKRADEAAKLLCFEQDHHRREGHVRTMARYTGISLSLKKTLFLNEHNDFFKKHTKKDRDNVNVITFGDVEKTATKALKAGKNDLAQGCLNLLSSLRLFYLF